MKPAHVPYSSLVSVLRKGWHSQRFVACGRRQGRMYRAGNIIGVGFVGQKGAFGVLKKKRGRDAGGIFPV